MKVKVGVLVSKCTSQNVIQEVVLYVEEVWMPEEYNSLSYLKSMRRMLMDIKHLNTSNIEHFCGSDRDNNKRG